MDYAFVPPAVATLPIAGSPARFPVRRVYCVGRNYADHAREMGAADHAEGREPPFFFSKPADALVPCVCTSHAEVVYPTLTANLQHEVELVVALGPGLPNAGSDIPVGQALQGVFGYAVGIDLTRRDLQAQAKTKGHPWDMSKGFDQSAPVGEIHPVARTGHPADGRIWLTVNGAPRQSGDLAEMIWNVAEVIAQLSRFVRLAPGDLIFTGTPAGVSTVVAGDVMTCGIDGLGEFTCRLCYQQ
ncbi:MAG TPA: fumarylacetoacetate hydrolase family protein [Gallionella sp.]|nr:fumarylacetoacetate hydrolase family protein [Gallionella sp.]